MPTDLLVTDRPADGPPLRVMALHALAYCQRLFYLEEVEEIRVADARVYAGRALHAALETDEDGERTQLELADARPDRQSRRDPPPRRLAAALRAQARPCPPRG